MFIRRQASQILLTLSPTALLVYHLFYLLSTLFLKKISFFLNFLQNAFISFANIHSHTKKQSRRTAFSLPFDIQRYNFKIAHRKLNLIILNLKFFKLIFKQIADPHILYIKSEGNFGLAYDIIGIVQP